MVFNWLKGATLRKFADMQRKEMTQFIAGLDGADDQEIALVVALATNFRHSIEDICDLSDPINNVSPEIPLQLVRHYQDLQKRGMSEVAPGVAVWLHTARASQTPENRKLAKEMWSVLSRGFTYVPEAASSFEVLAAERLNISGYDEIPLGFDLKKDGQIKTDTVSAPAEGAAKAQIRRAVATIDDIEVDDPTDYAVRAANVLANEIMRQAGIREPSRDDLYAGCIFIFIIANHLSYILDGQFESASSLGSLMFLQSNGVDYEAAASSVDAVSGTYNSMIKSSGAPAKFVTTVGQKVVQWTEQPNAKNLESLGKLFNIALKSI